MVFVNYNNLCYRCFSEKPIAERPCPKCGYKNGQESSNGNCLTPGNLLHGRYMVGTPLGIGGFGITYKCLDTKIGGICAVKEYFPANIAKRINKANTVVIEEQNFGRYNKIMKRFVEEAELVKSLKHRNIITIYDNFYENNTAYYVMEYCDGIDLRRYTNNFARKLEYDEGMNILYQIMNGLEYIHSKGILHRDIAPDNIYVTKNNTVKILDFGSARSEMDQFDHELSVIVKVGYAPIEQYGGRGKQGSYTDIYALGATFYHLFTGRIPMESTQRVAEDNLVPFSSLRPDLPDNLKYCIEKSMELTTARRIHDIGEMKRIMGLSNTSVIQNRNVSQITGMRNVQPIRPKPINSVKPVVNKNINKGNDVYRNVNSDRRNNNLQNQNFVNNQATLDSRMAAYTIDVSFWSALYFGVVFGILGINAFSGIMCLFFPVLFTVINTILEISTSATFGKKILGLYVSEKSGGYPKATHILLRNVIKNLGVFVLAFGNGEQLLEDKATDCMVCVKMR